MRRAQRYASIFKRRNSRTELQTQGQRTNGLTCSDVKDDPLLVDELAPNSHLINRDFQAAAPNEKWLTDITEFQIAAGKVYLSPIIDCFDGLVAAGPLARVLMPRL